MFAWEGVVLCSGHMVDTCIRENVASLHVLHRRWLHCCCSQVQHGSAVALHPSGSGSSSNRIQLTPYHELSPSCVSLGTRWTWGSALHASTGPLGV